MVLEKNMLINNRYRIQEQIGVGGMAIVYRAIDEKLDREVTFRFKEDYINDEEFIKSISTEDKSKQSRLSNKQYTLMFMM